MCLVPLVRIVNNASSEGELPSKRCQYPDKYECRDEEREILGIRDAHSR